jgi:vacuolar-type H+-ATPase subunit F/Vma7
MKVAFIDQRGSSEPIPIASVTMSIHAFMEKVGATVELMADLKKKRRAGVLRVIQLEIIRTPTFYDYLRSGLQLNLITAIDFTASNGPVTQPVSLHYVSPGRPNQYETCIHAVGSVICAYDTDQLFPVYGFGAECNGSVYHCLPLTFDPANPSVRGLDGILEVYRHTLSVVRLAGPTLFAPVIDAATRCAVESFTGSKTYTVLLIITDGCINDMNDTIDRIVAATDAPLSIVIVGVGNADFSSMQALDGDDGGLRSRGGVRAKRDIVQFVPFSKFAASPAGLAAELLAEIPSQVHAFCSTAGFIPQMSE